MEEKLQLNLKMIMYLIFFTEHLWSPEQWLGSTGRFVFIKYVANKMCQKWVIIFWVNNFFFVNLELMNSRSFFFFPRKRKNPKDRLSTLIFNCTTFDRRGAGFCGGKINVDKTGLSGCCFCNWLYIHKVNLGRITRRKCC